MSTDGLPLDWGDDDNPLDKPRNAELYERTSNIAGFLDNKENLCPCFQAQAVFGICTQRTPALIAQFRALASEFADPWTEAKEEVKDLLRQARRLGGEETKSGLGTGIHRYCHLRDIGADINYPTLKMVEWLDAYSEQMAQFEVLDAERFVVNDEIKAAGSYDRLLRDRNTGEILIGDIKSGASDADFALKATVQTAIYANSIKYDQGTGQREPLNCSLTRAVLIHVPFNGGGEPRCNIYDLDIVEGWRLAKLAVQLPAARRMKVGKKQLRRP